MQILIRNWILRRIRQTNSKYLISLKSYNILKMGISFFGIILYMYWPIYVKVVLIYLFVQNICEFINYALIVIFFLSIHSIIMIQRSGEIASYSTSAIDAIIVVRKKQMSFLSSQAQYWSFIHLDAYYK